MRRALREPAQLRGGTRDPSVQLYYAPDLPYHVCVVVNCLNGEGFIVTADRTDAIKEGGTAVAALSVYSDAEGKTLTVWFDNPEKEFAVEEVGDEVMRKMDRQERVIGFDGLNRAAAPYEALAVDTTTV